MIDHLKTNWERQAPLIRSIGGAALLLASVITLWLNEGAMDLTKAARSSQALTADQVAAGPSRRLVSVTGILSTADKIGDPLYLKPDNYIKLYRKVSMYAWQEKVAGKENGKRAEIYAYSKDWTAQPADSGSFKTAKGHENPALPVRNNSFLTPSARIGVYMIDPQMIELPQPIAVKLSNDKVILAKGERLEGNYYIYSGAGSLKKPKIGDIRVSYAAVNSSLEVTAFGKRQNDMLMPYMTIEYKIYRAFRGDRDAAFAQMPVEHKGRLWALRLTGILLMWFGLYLFAWPVEMLARTNASLSNMDPDQLTFISALVLSLLIMVISIYSVSFWLLVILAALLYFTRVLK